MRLRVLVSKELKDLLREPHVLLFIILLPAVMYAAMGGIVEVSTREAVKAISHAKVTVYITDRDGGSYSELFTNLLELIATRNPQIIIVSDKGQAFAEIIIPKGFSRNISMRQAATIVVKLKVNDVSLTALGIASILENFIQLAANILAKEVLGINITELKFAKNPISVKSYAILREMVIDLRILESMINSMFTLILAPLIVVGYASILSASSMGVEKEEKTLETLLTLPVPYWEIVVSKLTASVAVAVLGALSTGAGLLYYVQRVSIIYGDEGEGGLEALLELLGSTGLWLFIIAVLVDVLLAGAIGLAMGVLSQSIRGANSAASLIFFLVFISNYAALMLSTPRTMEGMLMYLLIPLAAPSIVIRTLISGNIELAIASLIIHLAYTVLIAWLLCRALSSEKVLLGLRLRPFRGE